jgi:hypothetical protein
MSEAIDLLPAQLFLLAYDPAKGRLTARTQLGLALRAAALVELSFAGLLLEDGKRVASAGLAAPADPVLATVYADLPPGRARSWQNWIGRRNRKLPNQVRDQLAEARVIRLERQRFFGVFPYQQITVRDPRARQRLVDAFRRTLGGGEPAERVDRRQAALVALAAAGELNVVIPRRQRREFKRRLEALGERTGPVVPALRKALSTQRATMVAASS